MTLIMGIVNVTPDSFSDGGRYLDADAAIAHGLRAARAGRRPARCRRRVDAARRGARAIRRVEQERVLPVVRALADAGAVVSIDTMNASTALAAVEAGARIVNDVSGGIADPDMLAPSRRRTPTSCSATGAGHPPTCTRAPTTTMS